MRTPYPLTVTAVVLAAAAAFAPAAQAATPQAAPSARAVDSCPNTGQSETMRIACYDLAFSDAANAASDAWSRVTDANLMIVELYEKANGEDVSFQVAELEAQAADAKAEARALRKDMKKILQFKKRFLRSVR